LFAFSANKGSLFAPGNDFLRLEQETGNLCVYSKTALFGSQSRYQGETHELTLSYRGSRDNCGSEQSNIKSPAGRHDGEVARSAGLLQVDCPDDPSLWTVDRAVTNPMLTSTEVYESLNGLAREVGKTVKDFRQDPQKFLRLSPSSSLNREF